MTEDQVTALRAEFPASMVGKLPKAGTTLDYVGHGAVTDRLLSVDPDWTWEPFALDEHGLPALDEFGNLWIRLTVLGVTRPGVGDGATMKVLIGDALRNAAMRFGVALDLWIRGHAEDDEQQPQQQQRSYRGNSGSSTNNEKRDLIVKLGTEGLPTNGDVETLRARWLAHLATVDGGGAEDREDSGKQGASRPDPAPVTANTSTVELPLEERAQRQAERARDREPVDAKARSAKADA